MKKIPRIAIVVARFNQPITESLLLCCLKELQRNKIPTNRIKVSWVPGAYELPFVTQKLAKTRRYDVIIGLGCVIKGETSHDHYVANWASVGLGLVSLLTGIPCLFGVLTPNNETQARARSRPGPTNRGKEMAQAALEMVKSWG